MGPLDLLDDIFGSAGDVLGWTWEKVITGIYTWFAKGVLLLMEWAFSQLDSATTPRLTEDWFANGLVAQVALIGLGITTAMMLISAVQMGWAGRPELLGDAIRNGAKAIFGSALAVFLIDAGMQVGDALSSSIWAAGRGDVLSLMDGSASSITVGAEVIGVTFLGPFLILMGLIGFLLITSMLFFRSVMIYLVAAFAPIPLALSTGQAFRGASRRVVSLSIALILAKPAITLTLVLGAKITANAGDGAGATEGIGALVTGFMVFLVAAFSPAVVFKLLPMIGDASLTSGVFAGMGRSAMTATQGGMLVASAGTAAAASAATRSVGGAAAAGSSAGGSSAGDSAAGGGSAMSTSLLTSDGVGGFGNGGGQAVAGASSSGSSSSSGEAPMSGSGLSAANQSPAGRGRDESEDEPGSDPMGGRR